MPVQYLAHGVCDKRKCGHPAKNARDRITCDEEDQEQSQERYAG